MNSVSLLLRLKLLLWFFEVWVVFSLNCLSFIYSSVVTLFNDFKNYIITLDLIHDGRLVEFPIIMQISYIILRGQTTQRRVIITNILATLMICSTFI